MIYSDFRGIPNKITFVQEGGHVNFYGLEVKNTQAIAGLNQKESISVSFDTLQNQINGFQTNLNIAILYDSQSKNKMLKDLDWLKVQSKLLEKIISKYELLEKFIMGHCSESIADKKQDKLDIKFSFLGYIDSYTQLKVSERSKCEDGGLLYFLIDKMTFKFNLATCFSRMSSRMDLSWSDKKNQEKGVLQASLLYQRSAGIYQDIISQLEWM